MLDTAPVSLNSQNNSVLKENRSFWIADPTGMGTSHEHGLYQGDTRVLSAIRWGTTEELTLLRSVPDRPDRMRFFLAVMDGPDQTLSVNRTVSLNDGGYRDGWTIRNHSRVERTVTLEFAATADFTDLFVVRGFPAPPKGRTTAQQKEDRVECRYEIAGFQARVELSFEGGTPTVSTDVPSSPPRVAAQFELEIPPGSEKTIAVQVVVDVSQSGTQTDHRPLPDYETWRGSLPATVRDALSPDHRRVLDTAVSDLRGLLLTTPDGPFPAAGIPWYVAVFGRDALLTAHFLLPWRPDVAEAVLRHLATHQGRETNPETEEEPGKILHELRDGQLAARDMIPHRPYFGTVDATALFVILVAAVGDPHLTRSLKPNWEAALRWMTDFGDMDGDGFVEFNGDGGSAGGTIVQSWKDSHDSMSHADGSLAGGLIAGAEVQGYSYGAFRAAATMYRQLDDAEAAQHWENRANRLQLAFDRRFWDDTLGTYVMALDGEKNALRVRSSNAGQLLWTGIVPDHRVTPLVAELFSPELWSGWGIRTLATDAPRYNPLSYHNGSVWPHDSALIAMGLLRYGYPEEARRIATALFDLASTETDLRLPELVAGYQRDDGPAVPYPVACRPQAWDAAALVALAFAHAETFVGTGAQ